MNLLEALKPALNSTKGALPRIVPDSPKRSAKSEKQEMMSSYCREEGLGGGQHQMGQ